MSTMPIPSEPYTPDRKPMDPTRSGSTRGVPMGMPVITSDGRVLLIKLATEIAMITSKKSGEFSVEFVVETYHRFVDAILERDGTAKPMEERKDPRSVEERLKAHMDSMRRT